MYFNRSIILWFRFNNIYLRSIIISFPLGFLQMCIFAYDSLFESQFTPYVVFDVQEAGRWKPRSLFTSNFNR